MSIVHLFYDAPIFAVFLTLGYIILCGVFLYMLIRMYKK